MSLRLTRAGFSVLRRIWPVPRVFGKVFVTRQQDVLDVLKRDQDFTIAQINDKKMRRTTGAFFLGMDRPEYSREADIVRSAVRPGDLERISRAVRDDASARIAEVRSAGQRIDVVEELARPVAAGLAGSYLGVPGPSLETLMAWNRAIFYDIFLNFDNEPAIRGPAAEASLDLNAYLEGLIADLVSTSAAGGDVPDTFLGRLICAQPDQDDCLDEDAIRRNISGVLVPRPPTRPHRRS